jgi:hypothetical protein
MVEPGCFLHIDKLAEIRLRVGMIVSLDVQRALLKHKLC